jgi:hypothetical protein
LKKCFQNVLKVWLIFRDRFFGLSPSISLCSQAIWS